MPVKINGVTVTPISSILDIAKLYLRILLLSYRSNPNPHKCTQPLFNRWIYPLEVESVLLASSQNSPISGFGKHAQSLTF